MSFRARTAVIALLGTLAATGYGLARRHSPRLVAWVVEEALVQKAPRGTDVAALRRRFRGMVDGIEDPRARLERLLSISQNLEKVQSVAPAELGPLLAEPAPVHPVPR